MTKQPKPPLPLPMRVRVAADRAYMRYINSDVRRAFGDAGKGFPRDGATEAARVAYQHGLRDGRHQKPRSKK